jgi:hypothetical protein
MTPQSRKAKGRNLQNWVRDRLLEAHPELHPDDIKSTSMGAGGEDIQLSPRARELWPYSMECKNRKAIAIYKDYDQATTNSKGHTPLLVLKQNRSEPLIAMKFSDFLQLVKKQG